MSSSMVTAIAGLIGALSALIVSVFSLQRTQAETKLLKIEADKVRRETEEIGSKVANAESLARLAYQASPARRELTLYDSRRMGFRKFDFEEAAWGGAKGGLSISSDETDDDTLVIIRHNTGGSFVTWLNKYGYDHGPTMIPVGDATGVKRRFRVRCRVRAREAEHTFLVTLKKVGAPDGEYLGRRRHRISPGVWTDIDDYFDPSFSTNCRLRFDDRSLSAAPSRLEICDLIVTEYEPPPKLMPAVS
jgi:hypothetical protein